MNIQEARTKAKELGINSYAKSLEQLVAEINSFKDTKDPSEPKPRRTIEDMEDPEIRAQQIREERREKGIDPLAPQYKLHSRNEKPGWRYLWALDKENRIFDLLRKGYQVDDSVERVSGGDNSGGIRHVRMKIPMSVYKEDINRKETVRSQQDQELRKANVNGGLQQNDGAYGDITIGRKTVKLGAPA